MMLNAVVAVLGKMFQVPVVETVHRADWDMLSCRSTLWEWKRMPVAPKPVPLKLYKS